MLAGSLRHRLQLQRRDVTVDAAGQDIVTWTTYATVWGMIEPLRGRELVAAQQAQSQTTVHIRIRYVNGVLTQHRIVFGSKTYAINAIADPAERNRELQIMCTETT